MILAFQAEFGDAVGGGVRGRAMGSSATVTKAGAGRDAGKAVYSLEQFLEDARVAAADGLGPSEIVCRLAPLMARLLHHTDSFLKPEHYSDDPNCYSRNAVFICPEGKASLFTMVWNPGQWTPIHDHGTWGVVGVVRGMFEERGYIRTDSGCDDASVCLVPGAVALLPPGAVSTFVPSPDHIHKTGNREGGEQCVTLHLYGRAMSDFNVYDLERGCREHVAVTHRDV